MKALDVLGVRVEMPTNNPIVLLRERGGDRYLPIWIGAAEATAIALVLLLISFGMLVVINALERWTKTHEA